MQNYTRTYDCQFFKRSPFCQVLKVTDVPVHAVNVYGIAEVQFHSFLPAAHPSRLTAAEKTPLYT